MLQAYEVVKENDVIHHYITLKVIPIACPKCHSSDHSIKEYKPRVIKNAAIQSISEVIHYRARRYVCKNCSCTFYEHNPFSPPAHRISTLVKTEVLKALRNPRVTYTDAASSFHISNTEAVKIFDSYVNINRITLPTILCIDEIHIPMIAYNSSYVCVMMDFQTSNLIELLPTRFKRDLLRYFDSIPAIERDQVKYVCIDMWAPYKEVVKLRMKSAVIVVDSFHVIEHLVKDFIYVRIRIMKRFDTNSIEYYLLKKWNWLLTKKDVQLDNKAKYNHRLKYYVNLRQLLDLQLDIDPELKKAYDLLNKFIAFNDLATVKDGRQWLNTLINDFILSEIQEFTELVSLLQNWKEEILNSLIEVNGRRISNGPIESLNGRIDKLEINANGVKNYKRFRNRSIYCFNKTVNFKLSDKYKTNKAEGKKRGTYKK